MPHFDIVKKTNPAEGFRAAKVMGAFDLQQNFSEQRFQGEIDMGDDEWQVGLIVGPSGSGKTTIARQLFPEAYLTGFDYSGATILDDMPKGKSVEDISRMFSAVGFSSVPSWLKPYHVLSNGEKMRVDLARSLMMNEPMVAFDEFTSVVDRQVAKVGSFATQKAIRKTDKKFIAIGCHYDVEEWLMPDWVFDTETMTMRYNKRRLLRRPSLSISIRKATSPAEKKHLWRMFGKHHYLSHTINIAADCFFITIGEEIVAVYYVLNFPHPKVKNIRRGHRMIVSPDYQGLGLGIRLSDWAGVHYKSRGLRLVRTLSSPALISSMKRSKNWKCTRFGRTAPVGKTSSLQKRGLGKKANSSSDRITTSWEYIGPGE